MMCFRLSISKESKKKISVFGSISSMLHQCVPPFSLLFMLAITKGYFPFLEDIIAEWLINLLIGFDGKTPTKLSFK